MFDYGIKGYEPAWQNGAASVMASHGDRLRALVGRRLTNAWLVWDAEDDEWFADCPVALDFDGAQVEINHQKFDDLSLTWNTVRSDRAVFWSDAFDLSWRNDAIPALAALHGQTLQTADLLEWTGEDMAHGALALGFGSVPTTSPSTTPWTRTAWSSARHDPSTGATTCFPRGSDLPSAFDLDQGESRWCSGPSSAATWSRSRSR
ncbi:hypothetical protein [Lentzea sp. NPDC055074]